METPEPQCSLSTQSPSKGLPIPNYSLLWRAATAGLCHASSPNQGCLHEREPRSRHAV